MAAKTIRAGLLIALLFAVRAGADEEVEVEVQTDDQILEENRQRDEVTETSTGLQYEVLKSGPADGAHPEAQSKIVCHYRGTLLNGSEFDSSHKRGSPATFKPASLVPGFQEALLMMKPGDTWRIWIPSAIGYGSRGAGSAIPPDTAISFELELLEVSPPAEGLAWLWEQAQANPMPIALVCLFGFQLLQGYFQKGGPSDLKELPISEASSEENPKVFLSMKIGDAEPEQVVIELFAKSYPKTAEILGCESWFFDGGEGKSGKKLTFKGNTFHRIIPGFMCQGGDFTNENGTGGEPASPDSDEWTNGYITHSKAGMLSMANAGKDTNGSQFFITLAACTHLDGKHVLFGQVTEGLDIVNKMGATGSSNGTPKNKVTIVDCGEVKSKST